MSTTETEAARMARLPKWAQDRIRYLERDLADTLARFADEQPPSNTYAEPYGDPPRGLGTDVNVMFVLDTGDDGSPRDYVQVRLDRGRVYVQASDSLAIFPSASNTAYIKLGRA